MRNLKDALGRVRARRSETTTPGKRRFPITTLTGLTAAAVAVLVGATGGTMALWVGSATKAATTITSGDIGVTLGGFNLLTHTFDVNNLSKTGYLTITNSGNVTADFTAAMSLDAGSNATLAGATNVVMWIVAGSAECTAAAVPGYVIANGPWSAVAAGSSAFQLGAGQSYVLCVRNSVRPTALTGAMTITPRLSVTTSIGGWSESASLTAALSTPATSVWNAYATKVRADGATRYWPLGEASGTAVLDWAGTDDAVASAGVTRGTAGAIAGSPVGTASTFSGDVTGLASTRTLTAGTNSFGLEAWIKTTSTTGGKIVGFGNSSTGTSTSYDRHLYMDAAGTAHFGVYPGTTKILASPTALNDGQWHHLVGNLSAAGMELYVDGLRVAADPTVTTAQAYSGYWRIGGDSAWAGDNWFDGVIDDVAVYGSPLSKTNVEAHWTTSGRTAPVNTAYAAAVNADLPNLYWRMDDGSASTTVVDSSPYAQTGTYRGTTTKQVTGAITGSKAVTFDGSTGYAVNNTSASNPGYFTMELWFATTTTSGGKLAGYGDSSADTSGTFDRHVVMQNDGRLSYGIYPGTYQLLVTPAAYNDGKWHHLVVSQGPQGVTLYVDGAAVATDATMTTPQSSSGYLHVGADSTWGAQNASSKYFAGSIDEVAVYHYLVPANRIVAHYQAGY
ncbi:MAG TPA: LamG domain-containing protein [Naasia sp.]|jgi:hypothetical protein